jgi:uncharacterized protein
MALAAPGQPRVIIDTSTLVGAMLRTRSTPSLVFIWVLDNCILYASNATLTELAQVVQRDGFDKYLPLSERTRFFQHYATRATVVTPLEAVTDCRNHKDNKFLELALQVGAHVLVSSDDDLVCLHPWRGVAVLSPSVFVDWSRTGAAPSTS